MFQTVELHDYSPTLGDLVQNGVPVFNDWWNTFVPEYKAELIDKITKAYWFNQIGAETPDRFVFYINAHLQRIMPYYNQLYQSELIKIDPMMNHSMTVNGRTIENLVKKANTSDDKFAKAIRDFAGMTDRSEHKTGTSTSQTTATRDDDGKTGYDKVGTDDRVDHTVSSEKETETYDKTVNEITDSQDKLNETVKVDGTTDTKGTVTDNIDEDTKKSMKYGQTTTSNDVMGEFATSDGSGTKKWTETLDDDSTTDTTTHLNETTKTSSEQDYADTPQKQLAVSSTNGTNLLRQDYLTNVTWNDGSSTHVADTEQGVVFKDDQTKEHTEDTTDKNNTTTNRTSENKKQLGGTDVEDTDKTGTNVKETDMSEITDSTTTKNSTDNLDKTVDTSENGKRITDTDTDSTTTTDDDWTEKGTGSSLLSSKTNSNTLNSSKADGLEAVQSKEQTENTSSSSQVTEETTDSTRDEGQTNITSGFMNVSSSALLEAFRRTFLNIDQMIIDELRNDFMLIY